MTNLRCRPADISMNVPALLVSYAPAFISLTTIPDQTIVVRND
jgi:hypothetical protein